MHIIISIQEILGIYMPVPQKLMEDNFPENPLSGEYYFAWRDLEEFRGAPLVYQNGMQGLAFEVIHADVAGYGKARYVSIPPCDCCPRRTEFYEEVYLIPGSIELGLDYSTNATRDWQEIIQEALDNPDSCDLFRYDLEYDESYLPLLRKIATGEEIILRR